MKLEDKKGNIRIVLSEKVDNVTIGSKIMEGTTYKLLLRTLNTIKEGSTNTRLGQGYYLDGEKIIGADDTVYYSDCLKGLKYVCDN